MDEIMKTMAKGESDPALTSVSNTTHFRFIPFNNSPLTSAQIVTAIKRQNAFLHDVHAISVINIAAVGNLLPSLGETTVETADKRCLADYLRTYISTTSKQKMFSSLEPGRPGQYYFLTSRSIKDEAECYVD